MIKKLRRRFMAVMMCIFTLIVCAIVSGIYMLMKNSEMRQADFILDRAVETEFKDGHHSPDFPDNIPKPVPPSDEPSPEKDTRSMFDKIQDSNVSENNMMRGRIMISADSEGNITYEKYLFTEEFSDSEKALLEAAVSDIVQSGQNRGNVTVSDVEYRFMSVPSDRGKNIVLLDRSIELFTLRRLLLISAEIASVSLAVLFVISFFLAKWAAEPVRRAWENQKEFFANASHELKTPLTVISANTDVIMSNPKETVESQRKWFGYIKNETAKMSKLISSMLYIAKDDRDEDKINAADLSLSDAAEGACLVFEALIFERGKTLVTDIEENVRIKGDKERISQLIHILIDNAVNHSEDGSEIKVTLRSHKNKACLSVSNTGELISKEDLPHLFDRFYRTDKSHSSDTGGFGLGLAIARSIAEKHGGTISVTCSDLGDRRGFTTFRVIL